MDIKEFVSQTRHDYKKKELTEATARKDPFEQFETWFGEAVESRLFEPNAMVLGTATPAGRPSTRIVLLRGFDRSGFTFFTNYDSRKGRELEQNPQASLLFFWAELERQVRVEGLIEKASREISDAYFASRPRASRIGALVSPQSSRIANREMLEQKYAELEAEFQNGEIPRPENWGGFILRPQRFEFWQGRAGRLHDRLVYRQKGSDWEIGRLAP